MTCTIRTLVVILLGSAMVGMLAPMAVAQEEVRRKKGSGAFSSYRGKLGPLAE